jgi:hypothetical protein
MERALKIAYDIRSRNVHSLEDFLPETWALGDRAETVNPRRVSLMLSIEGLNRLARQVIREFVAHAPTEQIDEFDYRTALPNFLATRDIDVNINLPLSNENNSVELASVPYIQAAASTADWLLLRF